MELFFQKLIFVIHTFLTNLLHLLIIPEWGKYGKEDLLADFAVKLCEYMFSCKNTIFLLQLEEGLSGYKF